MAFTLTNRSAPDFYFNKSPCVILSKIIGDRKYSMSNKSLVIIGLLGAEKDSGKSESRWDKWRPTVDLCRHGRRLPVKRLELLYQPKHKSILNVVAADIASVSPRTEVRPREIGMSDPWDFE